MSLTQAATQDQDRYSLSDCVDLQAYPLDRLDAPAGQRLLAECRKQLADDGCVVLKDFVRPAMLARLEAETERLSPQAHI